MQQGQRCPKRNCQCRLHDICTQSFFRVQKSKKCPLCKTDWTGNDFVGERAVATTAKSKPRSGAVSAGPRSTERTAMEEETHNEAEVEANGENHSDDDDDD